MIPLAMVVLDEFRERSPKVALTKRYEPIKALVCDRPHETFSDRAPMRAQERLPGRRALWHRRQPISLEYSRDRRATNPMTDVLESTLDPRVAPPGILFRHPHHEAADFCQHLMAAGPLPCVRPFPRDELSMPSQNRVRGDDRGDLAQDAPSEPVAQDRQPPPIVIHQLEPLPTQLASKDPILFNQIRQGASLLAIQPTSQHREHDLKSRCADHGGSLYHGVTMALLTPSAELWDITGSKFRVLPNDTRRTAAHAGSEFVHLSRSRLKHLVNKRDRN
jgi:hypothetical protein